MRCPVSEKLATQVKAIPVEVNSFWLQPITNPLLEAEQFLRQMGDEGEISDPEARVEAVKLSFATSGSWRPSTDEVVYGARVAWRNSIRCVGRMFWPSLKVFDARDLKTKDEIADALLSHIRWSSNNGNLRPALTLFRETNPDIRILNPQLILYAGYRKPDGTVLGDPKNVRITEIAHSLGWQGQGTRFDVLPLILKIGEGPLSFHEIPENDILEVRIRHPESYAVEALGLKWFALPAVSSMALDMGGIQYPAAPSSGVYQVTEIGCVNLGDPRRYNQLTAVAEALGLDLSHENPLWRDQAMVELNRAVMYSFKDAGVRIMDHHTLSESFSKFRRREKGAGRDVHGHWPWLVPPLSSNLADHWHDPKLKRVILKPGYFYQPFLDLPPTI